MALEQSVNNLKTSVTGLTETVKTDLDAIQKFKTETAATIERLKAEVSEASNSASDVETVVAERITAAQTALDKKFTASAASLLSELKANAAEIIKQIRGGDTFTPQNFDVNFLVRRRFDDVATDSGTIYGGTVEKCTISSGIETPMLDLVLIGDLPDPAASVIGEFKEIGYISHGFELSFTTPPEGVLNVEFRSILKGTIQGRIQHRLGPLATPIALQLSNEDGSFDFPVELVVQYFPPSGPESTNTGLLRMEISPMSIGILYTRVLQLVPELPAAGSFIFEPSKLNLKGRLLRYD